MARVVVLPALLIAVWEISLSATLAGGATAAERASATLDRVTYEFFKDQIKDTYPSHVKTFAIARAKIAAAKVVEYCPMRTSKCGMNPACNHPKRKATVLDVTVGEILFRSGEGAVPKTFENYTYYGKETVRAGSDVYVSLYVYERSPSAIARIKPADSAKPSGSRAINLGKADNGKTIDAGVGDLVIVELNATPGTGYSWEAGPTVKGAAIVLQSKKHETASQRNPEIRPRVGESGMTIFTYRVAQTGKATISLVYRRPWEKDVAPIETFTVAIEATEKTGPTVTGKIVFDQAPDIGKISRIVVSIRDTALADGPAPLIGTTELKAPFALPVTFAVRFDPEKVRPNPMFYSLSARIYTLVDGREKLYYINDTRHGVFREAGDTQRDIKVKRLR